MWYRVSDIVKANLSGLLFAVMVAIRPLQMRLWLPVLRLPPPESTVLFDHYGVWRYYYSNFPKNSAMSSTYDEH